MNHDLIRKMSGGKTSGKRFGHIGYCCILRLLLEHPMSAQEVQDALGLNGTQVISKLLRRMWELKLLRVNSWVRRHGPRMPRYELAMGEGEDDPNLGGSREWFNRRLSLKWSPRSELVSFSRAILLMYDGCATAKELHEASGLNRTTIYSVLKAARRIRFIRVSCWSREREVGPYVANYEVGSAPDAPKPKAKCRLQVWREYDQRRRARASTMKVLAAMAAPSSTEIRCPPSFRASPRAQAPLFLPGE